MEIVIHGHQTDVSPELRIRAEDGARKLADRLPKVEHADIRFLEDGLNKAVEIMLVAANQRLVARGEGRFHEPALSNAVAKLDGQIRKLKSAQRKRLHGADLRA